MCIRDSFFTFEHDYLFDELITDMPASADEAFYRTFFKKAETLLKRGAVLVLYNRQGTLLEEMCRRQNNLTILKTAVLNERQNSKVVVCLLYTSGHHEDTVCFKRIAHKRSVPSVSADLETICRKPYGKCTVYYDFR